MTEQELMDMELHDEKTIMLSDDRILTIIRVLGGWLYLDLFIISKTSRKPVKNMVFVPEPSK